MASEGSDPDAEYALSKLLQRGTVAEYASDFFILIKRVTGISESLLKSVGLWESLSKARYKEARFESIAGKKLNIEEKIDIVLSWPSEEAPPVIEGSIML
ncbi:hypothetical protein Tco_0115127 [Tanacetum coccineum]